MRIKSMDEFLREILDTQKDSQRNEIRHRASPQLRHIAAGGGLAAGAQDNYRLPTRCAGGRPSTMFPASSPGGGRGGLAERLTSYEADIDRLGQCLMVRRHTSAIGPTRTPVGTGGRW